MAAGSRKCSARHSVRPVARPGPGSMWRRLAALSVPVLMVGTTILTGYVEAGDLQTSSLPSVGQSVSAPVRDTLFLIGDARIDPALVAASTGDHAGLEAAWRRALGFAEWTDGAVLVADGAANYFELERHDPVLADSVRTAARAGAWAPVGGWWSRADPGALIGESLIRQGLYGQRAFERILGQRTVVAWLDDESRLPSALPQVLAGSGLTSIVLVGSRAAPIGSDTENGARADPAKFAWEGNDGTRLTGFRPYDFGDFADFEFEFPGPGAAGEGGTGHSLALYGVRDPGWESEPSGAAAVSPREPLESGSGDGRSADTRGGAPVVRFAAPDRALDAIRGGSGLDLPIVIGEIVPPARLTSANRFTRVASTGRKEATAATRAETLLRTAEAVAAVAAGLPGATGYPRGRLEGAWHDLLEAQALSPFEDGTGRLRESAGAALSSAAATADSIVAAGFAAIRAEMETDAHAAGAYVLFNPLAHPRRGVAFVGLGRSNGGGGDGASPEARELILVNIPEIPALGAIALPIGADGLPGVLPAEIQPPTAGDSWLENAFLRVEIDPATGAISSVLDKTNRRQALRPGGRANVLLVSPDPNVVASAVTGDARESAVGGGPPPDLPGEVTRLLSLSSSVTARAATVTITRGWNHSTIRQQLVLARAAPFLEIRTEIRWHDTGWRVDARFDPVVEADSARFAAPFGSEARAADGSRDHPALHWVDVSDEGYGMSILGEARDAWRFDGRSISVRLPADSAVTTRFAIYPHAGDGQAAGTASLASAYVVPLLAALEPPHGGRLGRRFSLVSSDTPTAEIEWVKRAEDDDSLILRLVERSGRPSEARIRAACPDISSWRANHLEEPLAELPSSGAEFRIRLRGNEIATVRVACRG